MEILSVSHAPAAPVPPVEITHIDVRLTQKEAMFIGCVMGGLHYDAAKACASGPTDVHWELWVKLKLALGVSLFNSPPLDVVDKPVPQNYLVTVGNVDYTISEAAEKIAHLERLLTEQEQIIKKQSRLLEKRLTALQEINYLATDAGA